MQGIQEILPPREARAHESKPGSWTSCWASNSKPVASVGAHGEWTSPSSGLGMLFGLKGWLMCSREFSVCVHVPEAEAAPVPGRKMET